MWLGGKPLRRSRTVVIAAVVLALVAAACSSNSDAAGSAVSATSTVPGSSEPTRVPLPEGFPGTVVLALGDHFKGEQRLIAVDVATGAQTVLADQAGLAAAFPGDDPQHASVESLGLVPGGNVAVSFGMTNWDLFEVPVDGSSPATLTADLGDGLPYVPSPDGRWIPVAGTQLHLVATDGSTSGSSGVDAYGPSAVVWRPDSGLIAAVPHFERQDPPPPAGYVANPTTGGLSDAAAPLEAVGGPAGRRSGKPWFDAAGQLHVMPELSSLGGVGGVVLTSLGADTTHRWVIGVAAQYTDDIAPPPTGPSRGWLVWWDASPATPVPHLLDIGVSLPEPFVESTRVPAAF